LFSRGSFAGRVTVLTSSTALAQLVTFLVAPLLTRLYSPSDFGSLAVFAGLLGPLLVLATWRYEQAIVLPKEDATAANVVALVLAIAAGMSSLVAFVTWTWQAEIAVVFRVPQLAGYVWLLPLSLFGSALYAAFSYWTLRKRRFGRIGVTRVGQGIARAAAQCVMGMFQIRPLGLVLGDALGHASGGGSLAWSAWRNDGAAFRHISPAAMRQAAWLHKRFPLLAVPSALLSAVATSLPCMILPIMFGPVQAGFFLVSQRIADWPVNLLGISVGQVYYSDMAAHPDDLPRNYRRFRRLSMHLALGGMVSSVFLLTAPYWAGLAFGSQWLEAGWLMAAMTPMLVGRLVLSPLSQSFYVYSKQHLLLAIDVVRLVVLTIVFVLSASAGFGLRLTVLLYSLTMFALYVLYWFVIVLFMDPGETKG
jgi:O-antigen/teichoic acid export membrane protein